jgi:VWFA-related protein
MLRSLSLAVVSLTAIAVAQDRPAFRAGVSQVHVDAEVLTKEGRIITGLSNSDFKVFDEGKEQSLVAFAAEEESLDLILLFDISGSMRSVVDKVARASSQSFRELRPGDRVSVMTFNTSTRIVAYFTDDLDSIQGNIQDVVKLRFGGGTYIQQAVDDAANYFREDRPTHRRRAILIITDNLGRRTRKEMSVVHNLWEADAPLSGLIIRNPGNRVRLTIVAVMAPYMLATVGGMDRMADQTGGDTIRTDDPSSAFPEMMRRIRSRYSLYYTAPEGELGSFRTIRVELTADAQKRFPGAHVRARRGYRLTRRK